MTTSRNNLTLAASTDALTTDPFATYAQGDFAGLPARLKDIGPFWKHVGWGSLFRHMPRVPTQFVKLSDLVRDEWAEVRINVLGYIAHVPHLILRHSIRTWDINVTSLPDGEKVDIDIELRLPAPSYPCLSDESFPGLPMDRRSLVAILNVKLMTSPHSGEIHLKADEETSIFRFQDGCDCGRS
ncbi:hypothetical protein PSEUBRA_006118 [Kalmanozyma brasiliensis GHG001]|uniref:uncharacterized protein n=1 Tax=Kalmanozyma brasiliensis (strain GHG001) TaxID=1365824 RepID=UPI001CE9EBF7|nr:uncharacterized protein PSEUBRA_006118 [Kalmanozyma brasiliensis GHG001]KAF6767618.1 hypothetical protein PSEUBRA_006118 [Kalmanozyma brasiliensis GHG001]